MERNVRWPGEITASHLLLQSPRQPGEMRCLPLPPQPGSAHEKCTTCPGPHHQLLCSRVSVCCSCISQTSGFNNPVDTAHKIRNRTLRKAEVSE